MDFVKQYIIQTISAAANSLRLSTEKIEVVALLREFLGSAKNIGSHIRQMKKVTVLSTFAIRLDEIYDYLTSSPVDLFRRFGGGRPCGGHWSCGASRRP